MTPMTPIKLLTPILGALLFAPPCAHAQVVVHDPINAEIAISNHLEEIVKLVKLIEELQTTKDWLGNAAKIVDLAGLDEVFANLQSEGVGRSRVEIATTSTSFDGATYAGDGLYTPVGETYLSRSGEFITRPEVFKPEAAIFNAVRDADAVYEDVQTRRAALSAALGKTTAQLQNATTHAEVLKATGVMLAQQAELDAAAQELTAAVQKAVLLDIQNRADQQRQEKAQDQEQSTEFSEALRLFSGALRPPTFVPTSESPFKGGTGRNPVSRISP